jgi:large subunit ribosomal protein L10
VALAKVLRDFIKDHPALALEQAYLEGTMLEGVEAMKVAELPSREELISRLLFMLQSPIRRLAVALSAPARGLAVALRQIADNREKESEGGS